MFHYICKIVPRLLRIDYGSGYSTVLYPEFFPNTWILTIFVCSRLWGAVNALGFNTVIFLLLLAHMRAVFSDPGIVPLPDAELDFSDVHSGNKTIKKVINIRLFCCF